MSKTFTWQEIAKHNTEQSCYVAIDKKVYDVTGFMEKHPGGKEYLLLGAGRDCTDLFHSYHNFTKKPLDVLPKYHIGTLVGETEFTHFKPDSGFYKECCQRVNDYFVKNKLHPKDPVPGLMRFALFLIILATTFYTTYFSNQPTIVRVLSAIIYGWFQAMILIHQMHDSCHSALGYSPAWWKFFGRLTQEWIAGASMVAWHNQHVVGHHVYTNIMGADPDLPVSDKGDLRRIVRRQIWSHFYTYQHLYMPLLYGLLTVKVRFQDLTETFINRMNGPIRVNPISSDQWLNIIACKAGNLFYLLGVPMLFGVLNWKAVLFFWFLQDLICGYYLAFNFQVSHVSTEAYFPCDNNKIDPNLKDEWAVAQVITSVDYGHENNVWAFLSGALNYQTVHHLFPGVSQYHYPALAPIVMEVCKKWKIPYNHINGGLVPAVRMHVNYLREMGNKTPQKPHPYLSRQM